MKRFTQVTLLLVLLISVSLLVTAGTAKLIVRFSVAGNHTEGIAFSADSKMVYSVGYLRNDAAQFHVIKGADTKKPKKEGTVTYARLRDNYDVCVTTHASGAGRRAYVPNFLDNSVDVLDLDPNSPDYILTRKKPIETIPVGTRPTDCALNFPEDSRLYVTNSVDNTVSVINTKNNKVIATIPLAKGYDHVAIAASGKSFAYVVARKSDPNSQIGLVNVIDLQKNQVVAVVENVGRLPNDVAFDPDGTFAAVVNKNGNDVAFIDTTNHKVVKRVTLPEESIPVYVTATLYHLPHYVYVANTGYDNGCESGSVYVIDSRTYKMVGTVCVGDPAHGGSAGELAISPKNRYLFVADYLTREINDYDLCSLFYPEDQCQ